MKKITTIFLGVILLIPISSFAEDKDVKLTISGETRPGNSITVKLTYPYKDLGGTKIIWLENDEATEEGFGLLTHRVTLGNFGEKTKVTAIVGLPDSRGKVQNSITITPAVVDILWEAQTAAPPFYRGKALPSNEAPVKTMAVAYFGTTTPSTQINYEWTKNSTTRINSGINILNSFFLGAWENKSILIGVNAINNDSSAMASIKVPSFKPSIVFYEISPTQGILTQESLNNNPTRNTVELSVQAIPFGFANKEREKDKIIYNWKVNNRDVREGRGLNNETVTFSKSDITKKTGEIAISLSAQNVVSVMQYATIGFNWKFTE